MCRSAGSNLAGVTKKARSEDRAFLCFSYTARPPPPVILPPRPALRSGLAAHARRASPFGLALACVRGRSTTISCSTWVGSPSLGDLRDDPLSEGRPLLSDGWSARLFARWRVSPGVPKDGSELQASSLSLWRAHRVRSSPSCCDPNLVSLLNEGGEFVPTSRTWGHHLRQPFLRELDQREIERGAEGSWVPRRVRTRSASTKLGRRETSCAGRTSSPGDGRCSALPSCCPEVARERVRHQFRIAEVQHALLGAVTLTRHVGLRVGRVALDSRPVGQTLAKKAKSTTA